MRLQPWAVIVGGDFAKKRVYFVVKYWERLLNCLPNFLVFYAVIRVN